MAEPVEAQYADLYDTFKSCYKVRARRLAAAVHIITLSQPLTTHPHFMLT